MIDIDKYVPKYIQIKNYIINKIKSGEYKEGDKIPSENELSNLFKVSRLTANCAIKELTAEGVVERVRGKGTFIKEFKKQFLSSPSLVFLDNIKLSDDTYGLKKHTLVSQKKIYPEPSIREKLSLTENDQVYELTRLMFSNNVSTAIDYSYIPESILKNNSFVDSYIEEMYLHNYLKDILGYEIKYVHIYIIAKDLSYKNLTSTEIFLLNATSSDKFLVWDTDILDSDKKLVATTRSISKISSSKPFITFEI